jgi:hypothetical protein
MSGMLSRLASIGLALCLEGCPLAVADEFTIQSSEPGPGVTPDGGTDDANTAGGTGGSNAAGAEAALLPDGPGCQVKTCTELEAECGLVDDGCGGMLTCGTCPTLETCGASGPNKCGIAVCVPMTCQALGVDCGDIPAPCGGVLHCGECPEGRVCGVGGPNHCGCPPPTCEKLHADCGIASDVCGVAIDCGACKENAPCGLKQPNHCG